MSRHQTLNPETLGPARGYSNGVLAGPGRLLFVAGQIGWDSAQLLVSDRFVAQFERALENVRTVVEAAGGAPSDVVRLTIYVVSKKAYLDELPAVGAAYRRVFGKHFPAMSLLEVRDLLEPNAQVEVEATAVIPEDK